MNRMGPATIGSATSVPATEGPHRRPASDDPTTSNGASTSFNINSVTDPPCQTTTQAPQAPRSPRYTPCMIAAGDPLHLYQISGIFSGEVCLPLWIALLAVWTLAGRWRHPQDRARPEELERLTVIGRRRSRRMTWSFVALGLLWPVLGGILLYLAGLE